MALNFADLIVKECRHGIHVWPKEDQVIGRALHDYGEFAEGENLIMARYLSAGDLAIDVGANIGTSSLALARHVGPTGTVIAFEPQPKVAHCLAAALVMNGISHVRLVTAALGQAQGIARMDFSAAAHHANHGTLSLGEQGDFVPILRLDDLALPRCDLIKIDVEGHEWQVIQGARGVIEHLRPVVYFEAKRLPSTQSIITFFQERNYKCYWHFSYFYRADNFRANPKNVFPTRGDMNILALPRARKQPQDLPEIASPQEDWAQTYPAFFKTHKIAMP